MTKKRIFTMVCFWGCCEANWLILSNAESGDGFGDILIEPEDQDAGIVIEVKYAPSIAGLEKVCEKALKQIKEKRYVGS